MEQPLTFEGDDEGAIVGREEAYQRSEPRDSMFLQSVVRHLDSGETWPLRVRNLSSGGLMADCPGIFTRGDSIEIELRGLGFQRGKVAWTALNRIGVAFEKPINPALARRQVGSRRGTAQDAQLPATTRRPGLRVL